MEAKNNLISNIVYHLTTYGDFQIDDVDIDMSNGQGAEVFKAERIYLDENNTPMVELENGDIIELEECDYNELINLYEEIR